MKKAGLPTRFPGCRLGPAGSHVNLAHAPGLAGPAPARPRARNAAPRDAARVARYGGRVADGAALVQVWIDAIGVDAERMGARDWSIRVPCATRGVVAVAAHAGERTLALRAFFMRGPDHAHAAVYGRALRKNLGMRHWRFAADDAGDLWIIAEAETAVLGADGLDGLLGLLSTYVDESFEGILRLGFGVPDGQAVTRPPHAAAYASFDPRHRASS